MTEMLRDILTRLESMNERLNCRVSTDEQVHGFSIDNQKERLEAYAISQGWNDFRFYIDDLLEPDELELEEKK